MENTVKEGSGTRCFYDDYNFYLLSATKQWTELEIKPAFVWYQGPFVWFQSIILPPACR